jgi:hypothetical protein
MFIHLISRIGNQISLGYQEVHTSSNRMTLLVASSLHRMSFQIAVVVACRRPLPLSFVERSSNGPIEHQAAAKAKRWSEPPLRGKHWSKEEGEWWEQNDGSSLDAAQWERHVLHSVGEPLAGELMGSGRLEGSVELIKKLFNLFIAMAHSFCQIFTLNLHH